MNNYLEVNVKDVKRYDEYECGVHEVPEFGEYVKSADYDAALSKLAAETLRADTAEAELDSWKETAATFEDFYRKTETEKEAAEQRVSELSAVLERMLEDDDMPVNWFAQRIDAALNPKPEAGSHE